MREPNPPDNEAQRLRRLQAYNILDTLPERTYDDLVKLAAHICDVPISLVSLVDADRQWFKARHGLDAEQTPRSVSFCGHVVESSEALYVSDSLADPRFSDNPLVVGDPKVRFYGGEPLITEDGLVLGTLCVIDNVPRTLDSSQRQALRALSALVMSQLSLRTELARRDTLERGITEARAEADHLRHVRDRFFDLSLDLLCVADSDGYLKELNPALTTLLGFSEAELRAEPFVEFFHPEDRAIAMEKAIALRSGACKTVELVNRCRTKAGTWRWLSWRIAYDSRSELIHAAARDITAQREHEAELTRARDAAQTADRTKSQFLATMSHELRTPLNAIIGFSNLLYKNKAGNLNDNNLKYLSRIGDNGNHLLSLINEVLDISKIEAGQMTYRQEACDVESVLATVVRLQESLIGAKDLTLVCEATRGLDAIITDQHRLRQVLINLVSNAIKFTEAGAVTLRVLTRDDSRSVAAIEVVDTGIGIAKEDLEKVFRPFEQADGESSRSYSGTGLGLAISRALCEGMGMSLEVESRLGEGTTFRVVVPPELCESGPAVAVETRPPGVPNTAPVLPPGDRRVLVVDDHEDARELISETLRELGCEVRLARDGAECLRIARTWHPHLITLDLMMPKTNGWQVLSVLKKSPGLEDVPVVIISMVGDEGCTTLSGAVDVLNKPVSRRDLAIVLGRLPTERRRALIIEDNPDARLVLSELLEAEGWQVAEAVNGQEGFEALTSYKPNVIFLDLTMPVMGGTEFLHRIRSTAAHRDTPVIVVTAKELSDMERSSLLQQANSVLSKGQSLEAELLRVLGRLGSVETLDATES